MKQNKAKRIAYIACCAMLAGAMGTTAAYAVNDGTGNTAEPAEEPAAEEKVSADREQPVKNETVYVLADANGSTNKVIVSDWLQNVNGENTLTEESILRGVENVKGDETFTENGDTRTWNASGSDIYYQGTTNAELPLNIRVTYYLNGQEISAKDILGKSGKVTVRFDYENLQKTVKEINGEKVDIYVPFAAITGMMLDNDTFRNVDVTNGKLVNDGNRTFIIGTAFPGLPESLGTQDSEKLDIPEYFEITADVTDFRFGNTMTIATNELFNNIDIDLGDEESTLLDDIDKLKDAMNQIIDGSDQLYDGLSQLLEKSSALTDGVGALYDGAAQLNDGTSALYDGAVQLDDGAAQLSEGAGKANEGAAQLYDGSIKLSEGLGELTSNNAALTAGSEEVFRSLLDMANSQLAEAGITGYTLTIDNYADTIDEIIASLEKNDFRKIAEEKARDQVTEAVEAKRDTVRAEVEKAVRAQVEEKVNEAVAQTVREKVMSGAAGTVASKVTTGVKETVTQKVTEAVKATVTDKVTAAVREQVFEAVLASQGMTPATYEAAKSAGLISDAAQAQLEAATSAQMQSAGVQAKIDAAVAQQMKSDEVKTIISTNIDQQMKSAEVEEQEKAIIAEKLDSQEVKNQEEAAFNDGMNSAEAKEKAQAAINEKMQSDEIKKIIEDTTDAKIAELIEENLKSDEVQQKIEAGLETAKESIGKLYTLKDSLDSYNVFYRGLAAYTDGVAQAADGAEQIKNGLGELGDGTAALADGAAQLSDGAKTLSDGAKALSDGSEKLYDGIGELNSNVPALIDGITQLKDGSGQLSDGCVEFNEQGITKITELAEGDLADIADRLRAVKSVSRDYETFTGGSGSAKFIYRTEAIE